MPAATLMIQGTTPDAGKSAPVTGVRRWLQRRYVRVAPFRLQNMALNSAVTADGYEIHAGAGHGLALCRPVDAVEAQMGTRRYSPA